MDPYPVRAKEFPIDPYYAPVNFQIYSVKVIPNAETDARIFPSWLERKLVWLELIFDPFALEMSILIHNGQDINVKPGEPKGKRCLDSIVFCPSYFIPEMSFKDQQHVTLYHVQDVEDRLLVFYDNPSPNASPQSLTSKIADGIIAAITDTREEEKNPWLELCFRSNADAGAFLHAWLLAFGRDVDERQQKKSTDILDFSRTLPKTEGQSINIDTIPRDHIGTPVSFQTGTNASGLILLPLMYEKMLFVCESSLASQDTAFYSVPCHDYGDGTLKNPRFLEVFIPQDKFLECQMFKYPKLFWWVKVVSVIKSGKSPPREITLKIVDCSTLMLREPLLPLEDRKKFLGGLRQNDTIDKWTIGNKTQYWWMKLSFPNPSLSTTEKHPGERLKMIDIKFPTQFGLNAYTKPIDRAVDFPKAAYVFGPQEANTIEDIFLGRRLGRLLPDDIRTTDIVAPKSLLIEQAKIFNHVLDHDFTLVDGAPATGKSKLITEIILGFLFQGKQVLVMATTEIALDFLVGNFLCALPKCDAQAAEAIVRLRSSAVCRQEIKPEHNSNFYKFMSKNINVDVLYSKGKKFAGKSLDLKPQAVEARSQIARASIIFMTTKMAERVDPFYGIYERKFDLIILSEANSCSESTGLQLVQYPFANAPRWLVIGCSKGIRPAVNLDEFKEMEICGSWFNRLLRHPEFRINPLRLTQQGRLRKSLYEPINRMFYNRTIVPTSDTPKEQGDHHLCMGFINTNRICRPNMKRPEHNDEEFLEIINNEKEQAWVFSVVQKIHLLTPFASIAILCCAKRHVELMHAGLEKIERLKKACVFVETIDNFSDEEVDYTIIHLPLYKNSYQYSEDQGRFIIAMTRARKGVFALGDLVALSDDGNARGTWSTNPWKNWLVQLNKTSHGAVFEDVSEIDMEATAREISSFKKSRLDLGLWLGEKYSKKEIERLKNYW